MSGVAWNKYSDIVKEGQAIIDAEWAADPLSRLGRKPSLNMICAICGAGPLREGIEVEKIGGLEWRCARDACRPTRVKW
jgi:hypothetical protein